MGRYMLIIGSIAIAGAALTEYGLWLLRTR